MTALRNILLALSIGVIMWMASCSNNGCEENSSSLPLAGFYSSQTKTSIAIDSLTVYGIGSPGDSAIIRNQSSTKQVYLPFDVDADCSRFVIQYNQQDLECITDTVTVCYDRVPFSTPRTAVRFMCLTSRTTTCRTILLIPSKCRSGV